MARKNYEYELEISADVSGLDRAESSVEDLEAALEGTGDAARDALTVLGAMADDLEVELQGIASAADKVKVALGDAFDGDSARVETMVRDLRGMGVEFEQIEARAKEFADVLQRTDQIKLDAVNAGLTDVDGAMGRVRNSSDQTRSVMANLVGNSAQDLGEVAGVAGTAGVAIGQLAEYAADGNVSLGNLAKLAGPMLVLGGALELFSRHQANIQENRQWDTSQIDEFRDAIGEYGDDLAAVFSQIEELEGRTKSGSVWGSLMDDEDVTNLTDELGGLGISLESILPLIEQLGTNTSNSASPAFAEFQQRLHDLGVEQEDIVRITGALDDVADNYVSAANEQANATTFFATSLEGASEAAERWGRANQAIDPNDLRWTLARDGANALREGMELTATQVEAIDSLMAQFGLTQDEVLDQGLSLWEDHQSAAEEALEAERVAAEEAAAALLEMQTVLNDLAGSLDEVADRGDAFATGMQRFRELGELGQSQELISFVDGLQGLGDAIGELADAEGLAGIDLVPDSWDEVLNMPAELGPVVDALAGFADSVHSEMAQAFEAGGDDEVRAWAERTRTAITDQLRAAGVDSQEQVDQILSALGLLPEQVEIQIQISNQARARAVLDDMAAAVAGLPTEVQLRIAAVAEQDPIAALQLAISELEAAGVEIPVELVALVDEFTGDVDEATEERTTEVEVVAPGARGVSTTLDGVAKDRTSTIEPFVPLGILLGVGAALAGVAASRDAPINAVANTSQADNALDGVARPRSAPIDGYLRNFPTESQIIDRMTGGKGYLRIPVDTYPRNVARFGTRAI